MRQYTHSPARPAKRPIFDGRWGCFFNVWGVTVAPIDRLLPTTRSGQASWPNAVASIFMHESAARDYVLCTDQETFFKSMRTLTLTDHRPLTSILSPNVAEPCLPWGVCPKAWA